MSGVRPPSFRLLCAAALILVLALWVGGSAVTDFLVLPQAFARMARADAVEFGNMLFRRWNLVETLCGAVGVLAAFAMGRPAWGTARRHLAATSLLGGMLFVSLLFLLYLTPSITERVAELKRAGVDLSDLTRMPPARVSLRRLHAVSLIAEAAKLLFGVLALLLFAGRRPR
ncbi:MAG: DUF4149 domain-containing protein [Planctomycetes bacterium]|nr:DUF4149 domain-containing protein [Planctomycetota bacterium]